MDNIKQGEILHLEGSEMDILVLSKDFFNSTGMVIACPIVRDTFQDALHIQITETVFSGVAMLEQLRSLDMRKRLYKRVTELSFEAIQNITDAVQGIFDYYPW